MSDQAPSSRAVSVFDFKDQPVRIIGDGQEPWFVAVDVCRVLEISKDRDAVSRLDDDERGSVVVDTLGGRQSVNAISEAGLYSLIFTSRKPQAREFKRWVTHEVLPAIRKTGRYELPAKDPSEALPGPEPIAEPPMMSVPEFLTSADAATWPDRRLMAFGAFCRQVARNFGLAYRAKIDPAWGEIRVYPESVLRLAWKRVSPAAALPYRAPEIAEALYPVLAHAVSKLEGDQTLGLREMVEAARELQACEDLIPAGTKPVSMDARKAIGRRMSMLRGKELKDSKGRRFAFFHSRVKQGVRYPISFLPGTNGEEVAA